VAAATAAERAAGQLRVTMRLAGAERDVEKFYLIRPLIHLIHISHNHTKDELAFDMFLSFFFHFHFAFGFSYSAAISAF
jgi:hypothetical protein